MGYERDETRLLVRKRRLRLAAGLFAALLVGCTLYGNTLLALSLPKVTTEAARNGRLETSFEGTATIRPTAEQELTGPAGWKVEAVLVEEGDAVVKGQPLVRYDDGGGLKLQIEDGQAALHKLQLSLGQLQQGYIQAVQSGATAAEIDSARTALESAKIDIETQKRHLANMQAELDAGRELTAPSDGFVTALHAAAGQTAGADGPDIRLADKGRGFELALAVPAAIAAALAAGDELDVRLADGGRAVQAVIRKLEAIAADETDATSDAEGGERTRLVADVADEELRGGERAQVRLTVDGADGTLLVSSTAVRKDASGTYVFVVQTRTGPLGNAFHAARRDVVVAGADEHASAVIEGLYAGDQVIVDSSEPLLDGSRVLVLSG